MSVAGQPSEAQFHRTWWVLFLGSFALGIIVAPAPPFVVGLASGALWGIAFLMYAVLAGDRAAGILGAGIVVLAAVLRITLMHRALLPFGLGAGGGMVLLGLMRTVREP